MHRTDLFRRAVLSGALVLLAAGLQPVAATTVAAQASCDPFATTPTYLGEVPTSNEVLGFSLGSQEVTAEQSDTYLEAIDDASDRVVSGTAGTSWQGRPLRYAIVGLPENVEPGGLTAVVDAARALRDPATSETEAASIASSAPEILWIAGNVHGGEESGTDASLQVLYDLADRDDCAALQILDNAIVVIMPTQNPDGREADTRRNAYGFDLNRDWFARTQPETDGKIEVLRQYPPVMFIDAHEMGSKTFFFPPNADPIYHEVTSEALHWINDVYSPAIASQFQREKIKYFNESTYDLFYMGYGDTVPATAFIAAGMTFEKHNGDPISQRTHEQYVAQWASLSAGALQREEILGGLHDAYVQAYQEGVDGVLQPNEVFNRKSQIVTQVPSDPVRNYFIRADDPDKAANVQLLVRRLQRMDVEVYVLTDPLAVTGFHPYGRAAISTTLPAGTYWIPLAQAQKHWVQAMLHEDTYTPFPYFYDVTAWSGPLLTNVSGGYSGAAVSPPATLVPPVPAPDPPELPADPPAIAVFQLSRSSASIESAGWARFLLGEVWHVPYVSLTGADIAAGALADVDVLLATEGDEIVASQSLGKAGRLALRDWVNAGGRFIGWRGGAELAARLGLSTAKLSKPHSDIPGSLVRVVVDPASPLAEGVGPFDWAYYEYDDVMTVKAEYAPVTYPAFGTEDFFVSGYAEGQDELGGTALVADEPVGAGRVVVFTVDPNFRAFTQGTQQLLWNSVFGPNPTAGLAAKAGSPARAKAEAGARRAAEELDPYVDPIHLSVAATDAAKAEALLVRYGASYVEHRSGRKVSFVIANPRGLTAEEHPFAAELAAELISGNVGVIAYRVP